MALLGKKKPLAGAAGSSGAQAGPPMPPPLGPVQQLWDKVAYFDYTTTYNKGARFSVMERAKLAAESANAFLAARDKLSNAEDFEEAPVAPAAPPIK